MSIKVNFRVVGIYCFIPEMTLKGCSADKTIQEVQYAVKSKYNDQNGLTEENGLRIFEDCTRINGQNECDLKGFGYTYRLAGDDPSERPYDANITPLDMDGRRELFEQDLADNIILRWQYYVSANLERDSKKIIVARDPRRRNNGPDEGLQPPYYSTSLDQDLPIGDLEDDGYELKAYNIIWRLLAIKISDEGRRRKERRRQRTSGRIV